jgi:hypothetical protein
MVAVASVEVQSGWLVLMTVLTFHAKLSSRTTQSSISFIEKVIRGEYLYLSDVV